MSYILTIEVEACDNKDFNDLIKLFSKFDRYNVNNIEKEVHIIVIDRHEQREKYNEIYSIFQLIRSWNNVRVYQGNKRLSSVPCEEYSEINNCFEYEKCVPEDLRCLGGEGWGCRYLNSVKAKFDLYSNISLKEYWYEYGYWEIPGKIWKVNKKEILNTIKKELNKNLCNLCANFDEERIIKRVNNLPERIILENEVMLEVVFSKEKVGNKTFFKPLKPAHKEHLKKVSKNIQNENKKIPDRFSDDRKSMFN